MTASTQHAPATRPSRYSVLAALLGCGLAVIVLQLVRYQVFRHDELKQLADQQVVRQKPVPSKRGFIADRYGRLLALDVIEWDISASPNLMTKAEAERLSQKLAPLLDMPVEEIYARLRAKVPWVILKQQVAQEAGEAVAALGVTGLICEPKTRRVYPEGDLTAHVVGIVNLTGDGFYGIEGYHNHELKPTAGVLEVEQDPSGREIPSQSVERNQARQGTSLILTLDLNIQYIAEQELRKALEEFGAVSGTVVVMDPRTGAILASVSLPSFDPNAYAEADAKALDDPVVSKMWEPGSIFKLVTWGAGLDSGTITPDMTYFDQGSIEVGGRPIRNWDGRGRGIVTMEQALAQSLNVVAAYISTSMGKDRFYTYIRRFGFGNLTGVDLASEGPGMIRLPGDSNWFPSDLGTNSFGQGIAVTPIQMIAAVSAVANQGLLMKPHIVHQYIVPDESGEGYRTIEVEPMVVRRAISEEAARTLTDMMVTAVETYTAKAQVAGYHIAGKSATAEIPTVFGYEPTDTIASYVGFAPPDAPRFAILVKLDRPKSSPWGTQTAAPTFKAIAERLFLYFAIPPDEIRLAQSQ